MNKKVYDITFMFDSLIFQSFYFEKFPSRADIIVAIEKNKREYPEDINRWDECLAKINDIGIKEIFEWDTHISEYNDERWNFSIETSNGICIQVLDINEVTEEVIIDNREIFVFGSNESGTHGAGAAREALKYGAKLGIGYGLEGDSFAIPTKDFQIKTLDIEIVKRYVYLFILYSKVYKELKFKVTRIGCGLAGFEDSEIAPLFKRCGDNCSFDSVWEEYLGKGKKYWGTYSEPKVSKLGKKYWATCNDPIVSPSLDQKFDITYYKE